MKNLKNVSFLDVFEPSINEFCSIFKTSLLIKTKGTCLLGKSNPLSPHFHNSFPWGTIGVGYYKVMNKTGKIIVHELSTHIL
jgi:hypothetical protein